MEAQHSCDESKCVSKGRSHLHNHSFTCYGDNGDFFPRMCADGFLPVVVGDEPSYLESGGVSESSYFTCCPRYQGATTSNATRHCSDPIIAVPIDFEDGDDETIDTVCSDQDTQKYPRQMKLPLENPIAADFFLCCDSIPAVDDDDVNNGTAITEQYYLDDVECVPYRNEFYEACKVQNEWGKLDVVFCDVPNGDFWFARPVGEGTNSNHVAASGGQYQCCKTGPALPPFVQDSTFKITVYTTIVLFWVAAVVSAVTAIGLLMPLLIELQAETRRQSKSSRASSIIGSFLPSRLKASLIGSSLSRDTSSRREKSKKKPRYSTYNLYLVYLAILDLIFASFSIRDYKSYIDQTFDPTLYVTFAVSLPSMNDKYIPFWDEPYLVPYMISNMWINAIISYQVLVLLQTSQRARRINQPSLTRVNLQAGGVCVSSALIGCIFYFVYESAWKARNNGDYEAVNNINAIAKPICFLLMFGLPGFYVIYVAFVIWRRGYIPSVNGATPRDRAMRELAFYFLRIVLAFFGGWLPRAFFVFYADFTGQEWANLVAQYFLAIQPILSTCMILTKSDARKYIWDIVTLSYLFGGCTCCTKCRASQIVKKGKQASRFEIAEGTGFSSNADGHTNEGANGHDGEDEDENYNEAADSLIFSVLGFRLADDKPDSDDTKPNVKSDINSVAVAIDNAIFDAKNDVNDHGNDVDFDNGHNDDVDGDNDDNNNTDVHTSR